MKQEWIEKKTCLRFRLGEITLFSWTVPGLFLGDHFTTLPDDPMKPSPPFNRFSATTEVIVMRSHPVAGEMPGLSILPDAIRYVPLQYRRYWVDIQGGFEDYLKKFSSKSRNTLMRKIKKFAEFSGGEVVWREYMDPDEMAEFHRLALEVSAKTYQERLLDCGLPADDGFRDSMIRQARQNHARGYILFHESRPVAYIFCPVQDGVAIYEYVGHDPEFQRWSPGTVLQYFALESMFGNRKGITLFDFTEGEGPHKEFFSTHHKLCADIYYFRPVLWNRLLLALHAGMDSFSDGIVSLLERAGLKSYIKKLLRSAA